MIFKIKEKILSFDFVNKMDVCIWKFYGRNLERNCQLSGSKDQCFIQKRAGGNNRQRREK